MIKLAKLWPWVRHTIQVLYAVYATGISIFVLVIAILAIFGISDIDIKAEEMGALGLALLAPLIPFVDKIVLPGGGGIGWSDSKSSLVLQRVTSGAADMFTRISDLDLNEIATGGDQTESQDG